MTTFHEFKIAVENKFNQFKDYPLVVTAIQKDTLWETYLGSFPEGTNPIYRVNTEHDCSCCRQFIKTMGSVCAIINNELVSIWDIEIGGKYGPVAKALSEAARSHEIQGVFLHNEPRVGLDSNFELLEDGTQHQWEHFHLELPAEFVKPQNIDRHRGDVRTNAEVFQRSMKEISEEAAVTVRELIEQGSLYRGEEHTHVINSFLVMKTAYNRAENKTIFCWDQAIKKGAKLRFRNTVIGTLLVDLSDGVELNVAVSKFEQKVAPANYKRSSALITQTMINNAHQTVSDLGLAHSLERRFAVIDDITINNVLFADRSAKRAMGVFDQLSAETSTKKPNLDRVEEVSIDHFLSDILPHVESLELYVENKHENNLVSLIAPENPDAKPLFKWMNPFSWSYNGEVADSIKERVKKAGGNVTGDMRVSLSWYNYDDLDLHVITPDGTEIYYSNPTDHFTKGHLDVDMNAGGRRSRSPVENIVWANKRDLAEGEYTVIVNNFTKRENQDFGFEIEFDYLGDTKHFAYDKAVPNKGNITALKFKYTHANGVQILESIASSSASKEMWGIHTQGFVPVETIMKSPNFWDDKHTGNQHTFFMLKGCQNPLPARGFYNEFLRDDLTEHRKVFEVLASKLKAQPSDSQLSGLGFSSTQRNQALVRVSGSFDRLMKINF